MTLNDFLIQSVSAYRGAYTYELLYICGQWNKLPDEFEIVNTKYILPAFTISINVQA